jgi:ATP-dependent Clp protease ATP-binding subunit ClpC
MLQFSPSSSRQWQAAAFSLIYSSTLGVVIRLSVFTLFLTTIVLLLSYGVENIPYFIFSIFGIFVMFELFYRFHLTRPKPSLSLEEVKSNTNLADLVSFNLARRLLIHPDWSLTQKVLNALAGDKKVKFVFDKANLHGEELKSAFQEKEQLNIDQLMEQSCAVSAKENLAKIDELSVLTALFSQSELLKKLLFEKELKQNDLENIIHWSREVFGTADAILPFWKRPTSSLGLGLGSVWMGGWTLETERYTKDINAEVLRAGHEYFLVGREKEVNQIEQVLVRTNKRNAILLGEPGLGKTTIVYSLARNSIMGEVTPELSFKRFLEIDFTSINASASEGDIEERLKNILVEVSHAGDVVLFVPNIENLAGALQGGKFDITGLLSQNLKSINLQIIGTSTRAAYHKYIEDKPAFADTFEVIDVSEPTGDQAIRILEEACFLIESKTKVDITYQAIKKAVELSERYMIDKVLPGKAIDLLDQAAASLALTNKRFLEAEDLEKVITEKAKVPAGLATEEEKEKLIKLEEILHKRIVSQDSAIVAISQAVRRARTLKRDSKKPIGVFLFLGPTGVGKTETAKALAEVYFGSESQIIRLDMSEFNQENSIYRLIGAPPGLADYKEGGQLTEAVRVKPFSLILLDELEKAHPKILEVFLAIFDEGRITDSGGRPISFTNSIIVATSNAGSQFIREKIKENIQVDLKKELIEVLLKDKIFKPEFINRFDDVIVYKPLNESEVEQVVAFMLTKLKERLAKQDLTVDFKPEVISFLSKTGYDPTFGARPLQRSIQDNIEAVISQALLEGKLSRGSKATIGLVNDQPKLL